MKLDRNLTGDGRGKYALIRNRRVKELLEGPNVHAAVAVRQALDILENLDVINYGDTPDTEFWVTMLRDRFADDALVSYAMSALKFDREYAMEVIQLAARSGHRHPNSKAPD